MGTRFRVGGVIVNYWLILSSGPEEVVDQVQVLDV
jgi:hypothetical protein